MLLEGKGESFLIFLLSWKGDIVLCVSNKWHNSKVHDTHSKSIIEWLILFSFLPALLSPSLPLSSHDKDAKGKKKSFEITSLSFVARYQTRSNLHSSSLFHSGAEKHSLIMKQKN